MGPKGLRVRIPEMIMRACRFPVKAARRIAYVSSETYRNYLKTRKVPMSKLDWSAILIVLVLILEVPSIWTLSYSIPTEANIVLGSEISDSAGVVTTYGEAAGQTQAILWNSTPFTGSNARAFYTNHNLLQNSGNSSEGFIINFQTSDEYQSVQFHHRDSIPLESAFRIRTKYSVRVDSGSATFLLYVNFPITAANSQTRITLESGETTMIELEAPVNEVNTERWLCEMWTDLWINSTVNAKVVIESAVTTAEYWEDVYPVEIDFQASDGESIIDNPCIYHIDANPRLFIFQNGDNESFSPYTPFVAREIVYIPKANYSGYANWRIQYTSWPDTSGLSVNFTVEEGIGVSVEIKFLIIKLDLSLTPNVFFQFLRISFGGNAMYDFYSLDRTIIDALPIDSLILPAIGGDLYIRYQTFASVSSINHHYSELSNNFVAEAYIDQSINGSRNLILEAYLPYVSVFGIAIGYGEAILIALIAFCFVAAAIRIRRIFGYNRIRAYISDPKFAPILLVMLSIFLPWYTQMETVTNSSYSTMNWIGWLGVPVMLRWTSGSSIQIMAATDYWFSLSLLSIVCLYIPLSYVISKLRYQERGTITKGFIVAMGLPSILAIQGFLIAVQTNSVISFGLISALAALPVLLTGHLIRRYS